MRTLVAIPALLLVLLVLLGAAQTPDAPEWQPDLVVMYESDTKAYYRPCG